MPRRQPHRLRHRTARLHLLQALHLQVINTFTLQMVSTLHLRVVRILLLLVDRRAAA
ncbi:hypothetical protein HY285_03445 [Candidatus Peregrinibacteria bacterium]|nr:hypothetical protein [Candidatus Peregrinibacteria bacterium]MBI3816570.1 hypothetical protein [Candidatus Peregrinibacteria bacterium]